MAEPSRNPSTLDPTHSDLALTPQSSGTEFAIESYANELMDELFGDLERSLQRGATLPTEPVDLTSPAPEPTPPITLPATVPMVSALSDSTLDDVDITPLVASAESGEPARRELGPLLDRILLGITCLILAATGVFWVILQMMEQRSPQVTAPALTAEQTQAQLILNENKAFLNYVQKSLNVLERRGAESSIAANSPQGTDSPLPTSTDDSPERVYIPVYQPPQALTLPQTPPTATTPLRPVLPTPSVVTVPLPSVASAPVVPPAAPTPNISPTVTHVLVGVLEQGDRSAALFEVNTIVQRIRLGESIGSSGWTLVEVRAGEAIVRRNGEVRSIYVGQQF